MQKSNKKNQLTVKFKKLAENTLLPVKGSEDAACFDVYATSMEMNNTKVIVGLGFATEIPKGYRGVIIPRSNLTKAYWVMNNSMGIIDSDYRGEWKVVFTPVGLNYGFPYQVGDRVAQIYFEEVVDTIFEETTELSSTDRGAGGFGSTGVK